MALNINPSQSRNLALTPVIPEISEISENIDTLARLMKGFIWTINRNNHFAKKRDLKVIKSLAFECSGIVSQMVPRLPQVNQKIVDTLEKLTTTLIKIDVASTICGQLRYNSQDPDPRLDKISKKVGSGSLNLDKITLYADVVLDSLARNPDQKTENLMVSMIELQNKCNQSLELELRKLELEGKIYEKFVGLVLSFPEIKTTPLEVLNGIKGQAFLFYFEQVFGLYPNNPKNREFDKSDESANLFFKKSFDHFYNALCSNHFPGVRNFIDESHPSISFLPSTRKEGMHKEEFLAFFIEMLESLVQVQYEKKLGIVGVWIQHEEDCLTLSITPDGKFGVFNLNRNFDGRFQLFEEIMEGFSYLSSYLFETGSVLENFSWTPLCKKELLGEVKKSPFGEIRFRCGVDPAQNTIHARGDEKSGLGDWKQETQALVLFDSATREWVFSPASNEGEFKFVLNGHDWEKGSNRNLSKPDPRPPRF